MNFADDDEHFIPNSVFKVIWMKTGAKIQNLFLIVKINVLLNETGSDRLLELWSSVVSVDDVVIQ